MENIKFKTKFNDELTGLSWEVKEPKALVMIITGMAEHSLRYDDFASFLNANNLSVYCLDHYGQGKNGPLGRPGKDYFFKMIENVNDFILNLKKKFNLKVYVFAHSMGSFMLQGYIEKYSSNIDKAIICGSNGRNLMVKPGLIIAKMVVNKKNKDQDATLLHNLSIGAYEKSCKGEEYTNCWISFNKENVKKYDADPFSGFKCSNEFFLEFLKGLNSIQKTKNVKNICKSLPVFLIAGEKDPVGNNSKGVIKLYKLYKKCHVNVDIKIYPNMRHEILNEVDNKIVYRDILNFIEKE